jgi:hypothetical protein
MAMGAPVDLEHGGQSVNAPLKARYTNANPFEKLFYEVQPYLYLGLAVYAVYSHPHEKLAELSATLLVVAAVMILRWRFQFRAK